MAVATTILSTGACYTAQEIRERSELVEDPRVTEQKKLWQALETTLTDAGYGIKLNRPQDKIITTKWVTHGDTLRRRVRMTLVVTNVGLGMNSTVIYQRFSDGAWMTVEDDPKLLRAAKQEEQLLVRRVYERWTGETLE